MASRTVVAEVVERMCCERPRSGRSKSSSSRGVASLAVSSVLERSFVRGWAAKGEERARVVVDVDLRFLIPETGAEVSRNGIACTHNIYRVEADGKG